MVFGRKQRRLVRLLVVEDEPLVAFDTEHLLSEDGFTVVATVDKVIDAVALVGDGQAIDLVLTDVSLADGSGIEVARAAAALGIPVLFVTGSCPGEAEALAAGCLSKPYTGRDLLSAIGAIEARIDGRNPRRLPQGFRLFDRGEATA